MLAIGTTAVAATLVATALIATALVATAAAFIIFAFGRAAGIAPATARSFSAFLSYFRHVLTVLAYGLTAFATCFPGFLGRELMSYSLFVGSLSALAGNLSLLFRIHGSEATIGSVASLIALVSLITLVTATISLSLIVLCHNTCF